MKLYEVAEGRTGAELEPIFSPSPNLVHRRTLLIKSEAVLVVALGLPLSTTWRGGRGVR
jgi:hypothetical protein